MGRGACFGAALLGAVVTPLNAWWTGPRSLNTA